MMQVADNSICWRFQEAEALSSPFPSVAFQVSSFKALPGNALFFSLLHSPLD